MNKKKASRRNKIILPLFVFFTITFLSYQLLLVLDHKKETELTQKFISTPRLNANEINKLQVGDIILRRGFGYFSDIIAKNFNSGTYELTHCGILIQKNKQWQVIHSLSSNVSNTDGIQIQTLNDFLNASELHKIVSCRVKNCSPNQAIQISNRALHYLSKQLKFDHQGDYEDRSKLYCSELVWQILENDLHLITSPSDPQKRKQFFLGMHPFVDTTFFDLPIDQFSVK